MNKEMREKSIQTLINIIANVNVIGSYDNSNDVITLTCPICQETLTLRAKSYFNSSINKSEYINLIDHNTSCSYLLAQDLYEDTV